MKLILWVSFLSIVIASVVVLYSIPKGYKLLKQQMDVHGNFASDVIAKASIAHLLSVDQPALEAWIENLVIGGRNSNINFIRITPTSEDMLMVEAFSARGNVKGEEIKIYRSTIAVFTEDGELLLDLGVVEVGLKKTSISLPMRKNLLNVLIILGSILLVSIVSLAAMVYKKVTIPLRQLKAQAVSLGKGDLETVVNMATDDELGHLAEILNTMRLNLLARDKTIIEQMKSLIEARDNAEVADQAKTNFIANMGHEIRTPLNAVIAFLELMLADHNLKQRQNLEGALRGARSLLSLFSDILDYAKMDRGCFILKSKEFGLREILAEMLDIFSARASLKGLCMILEMDPNLPSCLIGDPARLRQVLWNLVGNAIKFTDAGTVTISVQEGDASENDIQLVFIIADTGIGVPTDQLDAVFECFTQVDGSSTRSHDGSGLGLTIVKQIVDMMGGEIHLESEFGKGSVFFVKLSFEVVGHMKIQPLLRDEEIFEHQPMDTQEVKDLNLSEIMPHLPKLKDILEDGSADGESAEIIALLKLLERSVLSKKMIDLANNVANLDHSKSLALLHEIADVLDINLQQGVV